MSGGERGEEVSRVKKGKKRRPVGVNCCGKETAAVIFSTGPALKPLASALIGEVWRFITFSTTVCTTPREADGQGKG